MVTLRGRKDRPFMNTTEIIRAWKDPLFRNNLDNETLALLPEHPAGTIELIEEEVNSTNVVTETQFCHPTFNILVCPTINPHVCS